MDIEKINTQIDKDTDSLSKSVEKKEDETIVKEKYEKLLKSLATRLAFDIKEINQQIEAEKSNFQKEKLKRKKEARVEDFKKTAVDLVNIISQ